MCIWWGFLYQVVYFISNTQLIELWGVCGHCHCLVSQAWGNSMEFNIIQFPILKTKFHQFTLKGLFLITSLSYLKCSFNLSKSNGKFHRFVTIHSHNTSVTIKNCWFINIHLHNQIESLSGCQLQTVKEAHYNQYRFPHQSKQF